MVSLRGRGFYKREVPSEVDFEVPAIFSEDVVLLPYMEATLSLRESAAREAIARALSSRHLVAMVPSDGFNVGDIGTLALLDGSRTPKGEVTLKGLWRIRIKEVSKGGAGPMVRFKKAESFSDGPGVAADLVKKVQEQAEEFRRLMPSIPDEMVSFVRAIDSPGKLADVCGASPLFDNRDRLRLLESLDPRARLSRVSDRLAKGLESLREAFDAVPIPDCEACMDFADRALESDDSVRNEVTASFLQHVIEKHAAEVMSLIVEKYGPSFMQKRSLR